MKNYYEILELSANAGADDIKKSYRRLSKKYHPDVAKNDQAALEKFKEIAEAYNILSDGNLRREYDEKLKFANKHEGQFTSPKSNGENQHNNSKFGFDPADVERQFENFFGFNPKTKEKKANFAGRNTQAKKNPLDTSHIFESFFNVKKK